MSPHDTALDLKEYRLVLVKSGLRVIWTQRNGDDLCLPRVAIPRWTRSAEMLQLAIEESWHISSVVVDFLPADKWSIPCVVAEILSSGLPEGLVAKGINEVSAAEITGEERKAVSAILASDVGDRGPFSRVGWIKEAQTWLQESVCNNTVEFTDDIRQLSAGGRTALVRFATTCTSAYWLKAVVVPNLHEFEITTKLAQLYPDHLPPLVATRCEWNAWVNQELGCSLREIQTPHRLALAVTSLAKLQIATLGTTDSLLNAGLADNRLEVLQGHLPDLFDCFDLAMRANTSTEAAALGGTRLEEIESTLHRVFDKMRQLQIPDTLVHNDLNSGNILSDGTKCVFTDWCQGGVGNPLLTFEYLFERAMRDYTPQLADQLTLIYKRHWIDCATDQQLSSALAMAPILAAVSCLVGPGTWLFTARRNDARLQRHLRGLARYISRLAQEDRFKEALCQ